MAILILLTDMMDYIQYYTRYKLCDMPPNYKDAADI